MRETRLSGSMSGNRKPSLPNRTEARPAKAERTCHRETTATAPVLDSTQKPKLARAAALSR